MEYRVRLRRPHTEQQRFIDSTAKRKVIRAGRRGGKTTGIGIFSTTLFLAGRRVLYGAPTTDQIETFWSEVTRSLREPIEAGVFHKNETRHAIERPHTDQRIKAKTCWNADTLRGDWADVLILDEFQLMDEDTWRLVGAPMMLDTNGDAIFIYTPPSMLSKSQSKARDPKYAAELYKRALDDKTGRWAAFHFTSLQNPHLSREAFDEIAQDMSDLAYRQEILAEDVDEVPGALWTRRIIDARRVEQAPKTLIRVGVGVDPPGGATECGIVAAATAMCNCKGQPELHAFVLEDGSLKASPEKWGARAVGVYEDRDADLIVGEVNYGGDMVVSTIRAVDKDARVKTVTATRGKAVRAEPVSALYERGKVHHVGKHPDLEDEMCTWVPDISNQSPNRMDALVWVLTELMVKQRKRAGTW